VNSLSIFATILTTKYIKECCSLPLLREAVENMRIVFINRLIRVGAYKQSDQALHQLTLTELITEYKKSKKEIKSNLK